jgi:hypothetical protein
MVPSVIPHGYYSMSKLRTFYSDGCTYRFHLKYNQGYKEKVSSAAFLGKIAHAMIQQAYYDIALPEAHRRVWKQACNDIVQALQTWYSQEEAYQASGKARTKARQMWAEQHPQHAELANEIEAYKHEFLSEDYTWAKSALLTNYYHWSAQLATVKPQRLLHPSPVFVEGLSVRDVDGSLVELFRDEHDTRDHYRLLFGEIDGYPVAGVPDLFALDQDGVAWVADYKVMNRPMSEADLAEDGQLNLYVELLRQNGYILSGQKVMIGHIYLLDNVADFDGILPVWTLPSPSVLPRLARQMAYMDQHVRHNLFIPIRGIATGAKAPCLSCGLAYMCPTAFANEVTQHPLEEEEDL